MNALLHCPSNCCRKSNKTMSGAVKHRATAPSSMTVVKSQSLPPGHFQSDTDSTSSKRASNGSATLSYPSEASDDVNMNEVDGLVALDVILPDNSHTDITVDYNTPMIDLLVCLAAKTKLSPSGLALQLLSEDGSTLTFKPNQIIGALGGRQVQLVNKKSRDSQKNKNKGGKKTPFEMTNRFTVNLPRGQKMVIRVSPNMPIGELMQSVCKDRGLDPRLHHLQLPGKPGMPIDANVTVGQLGGFEINLVSDATMQESIMTNSMPDLSQVPSYMPTAGETKKRRGFLSFLHKKDSRKFKLDGLQTLETSSTQSHQPTSSRIRKSTSPPPSSTQRRVSDTGLQSRPKSMFVSTHDSNEFSLQQKENFGSQVIAVSARKKRRAPAPPVPGESVTTEPGSIMKQDINANENKERLLKSQNGTSGEILSSVASNQKVTKSQSVPSKSEMLSRFHSRNSSDSSGYHELTLSGCESPEAGHNMASKSKTSIDSASIESSEIINGADSGIHDSPVRVSPIEEVLEKSDSVAVSSADSANTNYAIKSTTLPLSSRKKKKAPAPPAPTAPQLPPAPQPHQTFSVQPPTQTSVVEFDMPVQEDQDQSVQESHDAVQVTVAAEIALNHETNQVISPPDSFDDATTQSMPSPLHMNEDPDISDEDVDLAFDLDDILNAVKFEDEPRPLPMKTFSTLEENRRNDDEGAMMMLETSSITSENIELDETPPKSDRPCAFIPPPPPTEPPPPEIDTVYPGTSSIMSAPVLIDKETEVNEDNTSLAPSSIKNSPENERFRHMRMDSFSSMGSIDTIEGLNLDFEMAIRMGEETLCSSLDDVEVSQNGYKNEMALFVERMSKMAVDDQNAEGNAFNDSLSSGLSLSETNSDTGSVIQHLRTDSSDSKSGLDSGSWSKKDMRKINGFEEIVEVEDSTQFKVSEEITVPQETVPPPPEFDDVGEKKSMDEEEEEEEEYTETIEELIIPLGPDGFDFTAARKISDSDSLKIPKSPSPPTVDESTSIKTGVFRAEPVSIEPVTPHQTIEKQIKEDFTSKKKEEKEEFILTTDDLSCVSFLPPRPKSVSRRAERKQEEPRTSISSAVLIMENPRLTARVEEDISTESIQSRVSQISFTPTSEPEMDSMLEVKPISLLNRPTMRASHFQDSSLEEDSSVFISHQSTPSVSTPEPCEENSLRMDSSVVPAITNERTEKSHSPIPISLNNVLTEDANSERSEPRTPTNGVESQYDMLQNQFAQWQEQLAQNQSILSQATGNDLQTEQLQQLTAQMAMQQNMMLQIQSTMQALQMQQLQPQQHSLMNGENGDKAASVEFPSVDVEQAAAAAEPPPPSSLVAPPPPPPPAASGMKSNAVIKSGQTKNKSRPKPKFERELDPRETLMIAIRSFQGREGLKSVSKNETKWIHSNR